MRPPVDRPATLAAYRQVGQLARQLHDALRRLDVMPRLQQSARGLPDARSRLHYVVRKSGEAAGRTLDAVERAKAERERLERSLLQMSAALAGGACGTASGATAAALAELTSASSSIDRELTEILLAQDFHDLTGQVVARVAALALELEDGLVELLRQVAPADDGGAVAAARWAGPRVADAPEADTVASQAEVDALLDGLGF
jgi:chemotaxis protein CheZ